MADDESDFDLDDYSDAGDRPGGRGAGGRDGPLGRWWVWLLLGVALGVAAALLVPRYVAPHLPPALGGGLETVQGEVLDKQRESGRLLLTLDSDRGAMLATFRDRVSELDLLVGPGDRVTLAMREFSPFVDGPRLLGVRKGEWDGGVPASTPDADEAADTAPPGQDTVPPEEDTVSPEEDTVPPDADTVPGDTAPEDTVGGAPRGGAAAAR